MDLVWRMTDPRGDHENPDLVWRMTDDDGTGESRFSLAGIFILIQIYIL